MSSIIVSGEVSVRVDVDIGKFPDKIVIVRFDDDDGVVYKFKGLISVDGNTAHYQTCKSVPSDVYTMMDEYGLQSPLQGYRMKYHVLRDKYPSISCTDKSLSDTRKTLFGEVLALTNPQLDNKSSGRISDELCGIVYAHASSMSRVTEQIVTEIVQIKYPGRMVLSEEEVTQTDSAGLMFIAVKEIKDIVEQVAAAPAGMITITIKGEVFTVNNNWYWSNALDRVRDETVGKIQKLLSQPDASVVKHHLPTILERMTIKHTGYIVCM